MLFDLGDSFGYCTVSTIQGYEINVLLEKKLIFKDKLPKEPIIRFFDQIECELTKDHKTPCVFLKFAESVFVTSMSHYDINELIIVSNSC